MMPVFYHVNTAMRPELYLLPRVPRNPQGGENRTIPRICVSMSVNGCLCSISKYSFDERLYVYKTTAEHYRQPLETDVPDAWLTGECWILEPATFQLIGEVRTTGWMGNVVNDIVCNQYLYEFHPFLGGSK